MKDQSNPTFVASARVSARALLGKEARDARMRLVRSDGEAVAVNLDIEPVERPEAVAWIDPTHPPPGKD